MKNNNGIPTELTFQILKGLKSGQIVTFKKKRTRWHLISNDQKVSYSHKELGELIQKGFLKRIIQ